MTLTLKFYRTLDIGVLHEELQREEENKKYWLQSMTSYEDKENGYYDSYNYNRCRNEALKIETRLKRINKVINEKH